MDGTFRVVAQVHADVEEEMAADPLLGEVGWSWLTDALDLHAPGYGAPSGTVTRVITEGYGAKAEEPPSTGFELRASWCPDDDEIEDEICGAVLAWCDVLAAAAGLPAQPPGTRALGRRGRRGPGSGHRQAGGAGDGRGRRGRSEEPRQDQETARTREEGQNREEDGRNAHDAGEGEGPGARSSTCSSLPTGCRR